MLYTFNELIKKVNEEKNGVGAIFYYKDGAIIRRFYENFSGSLGIDRASEHFAALNNAGKVYKVLYYWENHFAPVTIGEEIKIHFYDWITKKEISTRQDGTTYRVYKKDGKAGIDYNGEFTPLTSFSTNNGAVAFEVIA